jgi:hypothetical protein
MSKDDNKFKIGQKIYFRGSRDCILMGILVSYENLYCKVFDIASQQEVYISKHLLLNC